MWTPIALSRDIPAGVTRAVILDGAEYALWRAASGSVQVWEDRCPHRGMRLSLGFVRGDALNCLYHGWAYGADSACRRIPAHPDLTVPATIRANAFPSAERSGLIWLGGTIDAPYLPGTIPIASLAIDAPADAIVASLGPQATDAQLVTTSLAGITLHIGWHSPAPGRTMLHVTAPAGTDALAALDALHRLRAEAETNHRTSSPPPSGEGLGVGATPTGARNSP